MHKEPRDFKEGFASLGTDLVLRKFFAIHDPGPVIVPRKKWVSPDNQIALPSWLSEEDINYHANNYREIGFRPPLVLTKSRLISNCRHSLQ